MDDFVNGDHGFGSVKDLLAYLEHERQAESIALSHGDIGSSNIFVKNGNIAGYIDWGRGGIADAHVDISFAVHSLLEDLGDLTLVEQFYKKIHIEIDPKKLRYFQLLDELF